MAAPSEAVLSLDKRTWRTVRKMRHSDGAAMISGHDETDVALDQKRHELKTRLAQETRIGWPALAAIAFLIVVGAVIVAYLFLEAGILR
jgi:predicted phage tail protein